MPLARSFLYVPANREKFLDKAMGLPADAFIFDLEDSVPPAEKQNARAGVREYAPKVSDTRVWVRPNALDTEWGEADLDAVIGVAGIAGLFVPKVDGREDVLQWDRLIGELEAKRGLAPGSIKLVLSIESARGVLNAYDMSVAATARRVADVRRRAGRRPQHRPRLRVVDRRARDDACALPRAAGGKGRPVRHAARRRVRQRARPGRLRARHRAVAPPRLSRPQADPSARRSSRATGSTGRAMPSSTTTRACSRRSTRRSRKAAPAPRSTAA